jgi:hypothetical protein
LRCRGVGGFIYSGFYLKLAAIYQTFASFLVYAQQRRVCSNPPVTASKAQRHSKPTNRGGIMP